MKLLMSSSIYSNRDPLADHSNIISGVNFSDNEFVKVIDQTFSAVPASFNSAHEIENGPNEHQDIGDSTPPPISNTTDDLIPSSQSLIFPSKKWKSKTFYNSHYQKPTIHQELYGAEIPTIGDFSSDSTAFIDRVFLNRNHDGPPNTSFFIGEIGHGKSAFLNYIMTQYGEHLLKEKVLYVRLNFDKACQSEKPTRIATIMVALLKKTLEILHKLTQLKDVNGQIFGINKSDIELVISEYDEMDLGDIEENESRSETTLGDLITHIHEIMSIKVCVILDNMDMVLHKNDRDEWFESRSEARKNNLFFVNDIIKLFWSSGNFSGVGLSVVHVLRMESFSFAVQNPPFSGEEDSALVGERRQIFTLTPPCWRRVVRTRADFLDEFRVEFERLNGASPKIAKIAKPWQAFNNAISVQLPEKDSSAPIAIRNVLEAVEKLSGAGFRGILAYFRRYAWISMPASQDGEGLKHAEQLISHKPVAVMAQILRGRCLFSQKECQFPNIFLCHAGTGENDFYHVNDEYGSRNLSSVHAPTYWMKYLLAQYILRYGSGDLPFGRIHSVFCGGHVGSDCEENGFYSEALLRKVLGSICERKSSAMFLPKRIVKDDDVGVRGFTPTPRAKYLMNSTIWRFYYLQLILDDYTMPLLDYSLFSPEMEVRSQGRQVKEALESLRWTNGTPLTASNSGWKNYTYFAQHGEAYSRFASEMTSFKAPLVAKFLGILKAEGELENRRFASALRCLERDQILLPDMDQIFKNEFLSDISKLRNRFSNIPKKEKLQDDFDKTYEGYICAF